jgi:pantothenate kinase
MRSVDELATAIRRRADGRKRFFVAIAGPPGAGKSTLSSELAACLSPDRSAVVQGDGFHYDNAVLDQIGRRNRKGAKDTFDCRGLEMILQRLRSGEDGVAIPLFDRSLDVSRAGAALVNSAIKYIVVEGNYLLLDSSPWSSLASYFDFTIMISVPRPELERRLIGRWIDLGRSGDEARHWVNSNDLPNVDVVLKESGRADMTWAKHCNEASVSMSGGRKRPGRNK